MLKKTNIKEIFQEIAEDKGKVVDNSICGECSKCGECCTPFLPITQEEVDTIQRYVVKNNIKPQKDMLVMQNRLSCPYWNGKCLIYEVRPLICKKFYCYKKPDYKTGREFTKKKYITVNLWKIALEIEENRKEYWKKYGKNKI